MRWKKNGNSIAGCWGIETLGPALNFEVTRKSSAARAGLDLTGTTKPTAKPKKTPRAE